MVVSMLARIIHATNVYYDITRGEGTGVSCPDKACRARSTNPPTRTDQYQNRGRGVKVYMERKIGISDMKLSFVEVGGLLTRVLIRRGLAKEVDRKSFVAMKSAVMGTDQRFCGAFQLLAFRCLFGHGG